MGTGVTVTRAAGPTGDKGQSTVPAGAQSPLPTAQTFHGCAPCAAVAQLAQGWELCAAWQCPGREERTGWAPGAAGIGWDEAPVGLVLTLTDPPAPGEVGQGSAVRAGEQQLGGAGGWEGSGLEALGRDLAPPSLQKEGSSRDLPSPTLICYRSEQGTGRGSGQHCLGSHPHSWL